MILQARRTHRIENARVMGSRVDTGAPTAKGYECKPGPTEAPGKRAARGEMAEWSKAPVLKTGRGNPRGFESHSLRQNPRFAESRPTIGESGEPAPLFALTEGGETDGMPSSRSAGSDDAVARAPWASA